MPEGAAVAGLLAGGLGVGAVSALTPVLPAEAYVIAVALSERRALAVAVALAVALGQTVGKVVVFSAVRGARGSRWLGRLRGRSGVRAPPVAASGGPGVVRAWLSRAGDVCLAALSGRWGGPVVLLSAAAGLPPLLAVTVVAGAATMPRRTFVAACLAGRAVRFTAVAALPQVFRALLGA